MCLFKKSSEGHPQPGARTRFWGTVFIIVCLLVMFGVLGYLIRGEALANQHFAEECNQHERGVVVRYNGALVCVDDRSFLMEAEHEHEHHH